MTHDEQIEALISAMNERTAAMNMLLDQLDRADEDGVELVELERRAYQLARENVDLGRTLAGLHSSGHVIQKAQRALEWHVTQLKERS